MRMKLSYLTPLLAAGAATIAIAAAPTAMAAGAGPGCHMQGGVPVCPSTHSTLINASPGTVRYAPQYQYPYAEGNNGTEYGRGGFGQGGHDAAGGGGHNGSGGR